MMKFPFVAGVRHANPVESVVPALPQASTRWTAGLLAGLAVVVLGACSGSDPGAKPGGAAATAALPGTPASGAVGPAITVVTVAAKKRKLDVTLQAVGTVVPVASVDVKAQTTATVTKVHVREGQSVQAGTLLVTLDARADEANVAKLQAQMGRDEAALADAQRQLQRAKDLVAKSFISQGAADTNQAQVDGLAAAVAADRAALEAARLALSYTGVRAPASGRLGAVTLSPGTAVQANVTTLVTLTQLNPINIAFSLPQRNLPAVLEGLKAGGAAVTAQLPDDKGLLQGKLQFVDNAVDAATGTVKVKARFDNRDDKLWPGAFVNVALVAETLKDAVVIPTAALIQTARGTIVYVTEQGKASMRPVQMLAQQGEEAAVSGIKPGERIVVEGRQNLRPDAAVVERDTAPADKAKGDKSKGDKAKGDKPVGQAAP